MPEEKVDTITCPNPECEFQVDTTGLVTKCPKCGQDLVSVLQGLGFALTEEFVFDAKGRMMNPRFWDYKIPGAPDAPEMVTILVPTHEDTGPFGAKSVAEIAINGPAPAVANAIFDAVGIRLLELPMTPERVWRKLKEGSPA